MTEKFTAEELKIAARVAKDRGWDAFATRLEQDARKSHESINRFFVGKLAATENCVCTVDDNLHVWVKRDNGSWYDHTQGCGFGTVEHPYYKDLKLVPTPSREAERQVWNDLAEAPIAKRVRDREGDVWAYQSSEGRGFGHGWGYADSHGGHVSVERERWSRYAPFTEVLDGEE